MCLLIWWTLHTAKIRSEFTPTQRAAIALGSVEHSSFTGHLMPIFAVVELGVGIFDIWINWKHAHAIFTLFKCQILTLCREYYYKLQTHHGRRWSTRRWSLINFCFPSLPAAAWSCSIRHLWVKLPVEHAHVRVYDERLSQEGSDTPDSQFVTCINACEAVWLFSHSVSHVTRYAAVTCDLTRADCAIYTSQLEWFNCLLQLQ